jgi:hypothetical protein
VLQIVADAELNEARAEPGDRGEGRWWPWAVLFVLILLALMVRSFGLLAADMTEDEQLSTQFEHWSYAELIENHDTLSPLAYLIQKCFMDLTGNYGIGGIRWPSAFEGALGVAVLFGFAWAMGGARLAIPAGVLLCFSYYHFQWSRDGRYYPLLTVTTLSFLWCYWSVFAKQRLRWVPGVVLLGLAVMASHRSGALFLLGCGLALPILLCSPAWLQLVHTRKKTVLGIGASVLVLVLAASPFLREFWDLAVGHFEAAGEQNAMTPLFDIQPAFLVNVSGLYLGAGRPALYGLLLIAALGLMVLARQDWRTAVLFVSILVTPFAATWILRPTHWWHDKYFIFVLPVLILLLVLGMDGIAQRLKGRGLRAGACGLLMLLFLVPNATAMLRAYAYPNRQHQEASELLKLWAGPQDHIRFTWHRTMDVMYHIFEPPHAGIYLDALKPDEALEWTLSDAPRTWIVHYADGTRPPEVVNPFVSDRMSRLPLGRLLLGFGPNPQGIRFGSNAPGHPDADCPLVVPPQAQQAIDLMAPRAGRRMLIVESVEEARFDSLQVKFHTGDPLVVPFDPALNVHAAKIEAPYGRNRLYVANPDSKSPVTVLSVSLLPVLEEGALTLPAWDFASLSGGEPGGMFWTEPEGDTFVLSAISPGAEVAYCFFSDTEQEVRVWVEAKNDRPGPNEYDLWLNEEQGVTRHVTFDAENDKFTKSEAGVLHAKQGANRLYIRYQGLPQEARTAHAVTESGLLVLTPRRVQVPAIKSLTIESIPRETP